ncbi:phosphoinositide phospholipase C 2-like isoform X1 [Panicum virgatum]|uniref:phosphoinositide phospholipase C 2-like isoform X1 n=1 Tax=Panicum virgatum TaxID=38727 RepID=UPI0019D5F25A|nr:phosphoinositide phospholipase C 2-like isoform X1 [Panicum virgatum]
MPKPDKGAPPRASPPHTPPPGTESEAEAADEAGVSAVEMGTYKCCIFFTRRFALGDTTTPEDVRVLFSRFAGGSPYMGADDLRRYLAAWGGADGEVAEQVVDRVLQDRSRTPRFGRPALTVDDFMHFLFSEDLNPPLRHSKVHQDMNAPLSHYFIYTGHNSYLTGNQLSSDCSDAPIIKALQIGVRVIELDIWPNSSKDDIDVLHGRTLTAPVSLIKCLRSIKEYAFVASPYPVIITLEDHLTPDLQAKVAKMVLEVFGDILYYPESKHLQEFPSPEALKGRVLLSTKPPKEYLEAKGGTMKDREIEPQFKKGEREEAAWGVEVPDIQDEMQIADRQSEDDILYHERGLDDNDSQKVCKHAAPEYKHLITIKAGKPKGALVDALKNDPDKVRRLSLSEQELAKVAARNGPNIVSFTHRNMLRIYPKGTRFNSSNYNPFLGWVHGAQMVAFNMQGHGRALWLMYGFYKANGGCGYVKKPDFLMQTCPDGKVFDPKADLPVKATLKVKIYMGEGWHKDFKQTHFDSYSPPDFYVKVGIAGVPLDSVMRKTKAVEDNWVPVWEEEFAFPLTVPEIAVLRVEVHEQDVSEDDFGGQTALPVEELRPGIRAVSLFDHKGHKFRNVKLLMRFEFT